jgi:glycosyltransferase involved in cell wall biosynthesis
VSRVLIVGKGHPETGGIPTFLETLLTSSLQRDHALSFLNLAGGDVGGRWSGSNVARTLRDARRLRREVAGHDLVHVHTALAPGATVMRAGALVLAARSRRVPVLVHAHGGRVQLWLTSTWRRRLAAAALRGAEEVLAVSEGAAGALRPALGDRVRLVENGVDVAVFTPGAPDTHRARPRVLFVGLLSERKGVLDLLEASDRLAADGVDHEVHLVGGPPPDDPDAAAAIVEAARSRRDRVVLRGAVDRSEMPSTYREAEIFCLPSWWEAMPLSVLEAMACGVSVVASDVGDVARIVDDGVTGRVVPARDVDALAAALASVLGDADARSEMGAAGRRRVVDRWTIERTLDAIGERYDRSSHSRP